jgi:hypothetical protein
MRRPRQARPERNSLAEIARMADPETIHHHLCDRLPRSGISVGHVLCERLFRYGLTAARSRRAFVITDTDERLMASAAIIGDSSQPVIGYNRPAARGTPRAL